MDLPLLSRRLAEDLDRLSFGPPVATVYNPLVHARRLHEAWLDRWCQGTREIVLLGMNPGPWGMTQTGVPFGDPAMVLDWLGLRATVDPPAHPHPKVPVRGLESPRHEVSGQRLWGWARDRFGTPDIFFQRFFVANWCPLSFMEEGGRNRTPDHLSPTEREALFPICDQALRDLVEIVRPRLVVGVGSFAETRAREALTGMDLRIARILHPSPANPAANRGWAGLVDEAFAEMGVSITPGDGLGPR